jgi:hypothetical protein
MSAVPARVMNFFSPLISTPPLGASTKRVARRATSLPAPGSVSAKADWVRPAARPGSSASFSAALPPATMGRDDRSVPVTSDAAVVQALASSSTMRTRASMLASVPPQARGKALAITPSRASRRKVSQANTSSCATRCASGPICVATSSRTRWTRAASAAGSFTSGWASAVRGMCVASRWCQTVPASISACSSASVRPSSSM